jgi:hypothetical protein
VHVAASVFWAGSCFVLARPGASGAQALFRPQMVAATIAIFAGGGLWSMYRLSGFGHMVMILTVGAVCAIAAAGVQGALVGGTIRKMKAGALAEADARRTMALGNRIAAGLLAVTLITMVAAQSA